MIKIILAITIFLLTHSIEIPLHNGPRCMVITTTFEPLKVQMKFPMIPAKREGEKFQIQLLDFLTQQVQFETQVPEGAVYRKNFELEVDQLYHLCMEVVQVRNQFSFDEEVYVEYSATQDFESLIGNVEIPQELQGQKNLEQIYKLSQSMNNINKNIIKNQARQRELENKLTISNLHKNERIVLLTLIQVLVIVISGLYQIFALRRFLIEKNLY